MPTTETITQIISSPGDDNIRVVDQNMAPHTNEVSVIMSPLAMMRENDAEILERGIDECSNPPTPAVPASDNKCVCPPYMDLDNVIGEEGCQQHGQLTEDDHSLENCCRVLHESSTVYESILHTSSDSKPTSFIPCSGMNESIVDETVQRKCQGKAEDVLQGELKAFGKDQSLSIGSLYGLKQPIPCRLQHEAFEKKINQTKHTSHEVSCDSGDIQVPLSEQTSYDRININSNFSSRNANTEVKLEESDDFTDISLPERQYGSFSGLKSIPGQCESSTNPISSPVSVAEEHSKPSSTHSVAICRENLHTERSKSTNRRILEAAQFAEAVGEIPPTSEDEILRIIIEDVSSSDEDDDSIEEIGLQQKADILGSSFHPHLQSPLPNSKVSESLNINSDQSNANTAPHSIARNHNANCSKDVLISRGNLNSNTPLFDISLLSSPRPNSKYTNHSCSPPPTLRSPTDCLIEEELNERVQHKLETSVEDDGDASMSFIQITENKGMRRNSLSLNHSIKGDQQPLDVELEFSSTIEIPSGFYDIDPPHYLPSENSAMHENIKRSFKHHLATSVEKSLLLCKDSGCRSGSLVGDEVDHEISSECQHTPYIYKGIRHNPPEITKRGISRGNYAQLHRKAWLEVSDKYHRYGKNLRLYYKHWESLGHPTNMFFDWLDSKNEAAGRELPNLKECPRSELDSDTVLYIHNPEMQQKYLLKILPKSANEPARLVDCNGSPVVTGPDGWIFVLRDHEIYGAKKVTSVAQYSKQRFHHSSFFGGKAVAAAGILITGDSGELKLLYPHSGHYRPGEAHMQRMLYHLYQCGVDLKSFDVDMQQIMHVSREKRDATTPKGGDVDEQDDCQQVAAGKMKKAKKTDSLHLESGINVALFLGHKAQMIEKGIFKQIQKIRSLKPAKVSAAFKGEDDVGILKRTSQMTVQ